MNVAEISIPTTYKEFIGKSLPHVNTIFEIADGLPTVEFSEKWGNGTGYFDNACYDEGITSPSRTKDDYGRVVVLIPLNNGDNFVAFQRYTDNGEILVSNGGEVHAVFETMMSPAEKAFLYVASHGKICQSHIDEAIEAHKSNLIDPSSECGRENIKRAKKSLALFII